MKILGEKTFPVTTILKYLIGIKNYIFYLQTKLPHGASKRLSFGDNQKKCENKKNYVILFPYLGLGQQGIILCFFCFLNNININNVQQYYIMFLYKSILTPPELLTESTAK